MNEKKSVTRKENFAGRVHGERFWRIHEDGRPDPALPKASGWKGQPDCLETLRRLKQLSE